RREVAYAETPHEVGRAPAHGRRPLHVLVMSANHRGGNPSRRSPAYDGLRVHELNSLRTDGWYGDRPLALAFPDDWDVSVAVPRTPPRLGDGELEAAPARPA